MYEFRVIPDHADPFDLTVSSRDVLLWERTGKGKYAAKLAETGSYSDFYSIAYIAARRQGLWEGTREEFEQQCDIELSDDEEDAPAVDPTQEVA